jgi:predicted nucleotidyltransferase
MLPQKLIEEITHKIVRYYNPDKVIVFGSYAKDYNTHKSDIDIMVLKDTDVPKSARGRELQHFFFGSVIPIDFHFYTNEEFDEEKNVPHSFAHSIYETGKEIYVKKPR